jgi:hypothetical protein
LAQHARVGQQLADFFRVAGFEGLPELGRLEFGGAEARDDVRGVG